MSLLVKIASSATQLSVIMVSPPPAVLGRNLHPPIKKLASDLNVVPWYSVAWSMCLIFSGHVGKEYRATSEFTGLLWLRDTGRDVSPSYAIRPCRSKSPKTRSSSGIQSHGRRGQVPVLRWVGTLCSECRQLRWDCSSSLVPILSLGQRFVQMNLSFICQYCSF